MEQQELFERLVELLDRQTQQPTDEEKSAHLRDFFAAAALQGILAHEGGEIGTWCTSASYRFADAMLKDRLTK